MSIMTIGFIGLGLIGGSIAKAIHVKLPEIKCIAYQSKDSNDNTIKQAIKDQVIFDATPDLAILTRECDIIFLCAPVLNNIEYLSLLKEHITGNTIITDVGSVKSNIHKAAASLGLNGCFIGGHPMAGSEKTGYHNSSELLLENAYYILTVTDELPKDDVLMVSQLIEKIGALPVVLNASAHDDIVAAISHVPHIIASSLVNMVRAKDDSKERMKVLAAGGFKDITRIASSSPIMWQNICLSNTESILDFLSHYENQLSLIKTLIANKDEAGLLSFFEGAKDYRDNLPLRSKGLLSEVYEVYVDIFDETGAIATIATILATNQVSIKNIGILHNREFEQGVLRIELYDEEAQKKANTLLKSRGYVLYEKK